MSHFPRFVPATGHSVTVFPRLGLNRRLPGEWEPIQVQLVAFDDEQARETARLRDRTLGLGLSLADRAALGLARLRGLPVLTADRAWRVLKPGIHVEVIR